MKPLICIFVLLLAVRAASAASDGAVDATFGLYQGHGVYFGTSPHRAGVPAIVDVLSLPDGKIIVVGNEAWGWQGQDGTEYTNAIRVTRLLANGGLDFSFGNYGTVDIVSPYQGGEYYEATSAAIDPGGRIAIAGFYQDNYDLPRQSMAVWMLKADGTQDASFGNHYALQVYDRGNDWSLDKAFAIHAFTNRDFERILNPVEAFFVVGELRDDTSPGDYTSNPGPRRGVEWFIGPNGDLAGEEEPPLPSGCSENPLYAVDASTSVPGYIAAYAAGDMVCSDGTVAYAQRFIYYGTDGKLKSDYTYGGGAGISYFSFLDGGTPDSHCSAVAVDTSGRAVIGGTAFVDGGWNAVGVARLTAAGQFDTSFSGDGTRDIQFADLPSTDPAQVHMVDMRLQHDGKIVLGGDVMLTNAGQVFFAMRMKPDGSGDPDFEPTNVLSHIVSTDYGDFAFDVNGAGWYDSATEFVQDGAMSASAMTFTQGDRLLLVGSAPSTHFEGESIVVERIDNDGIFSDNFGW